MEGVCGRGSKSEGIWCGASLDLTPEKLVVEKSLRLDFSTTNNEVEYEALLEGMSMVQRMGGKSATMFSDSRLVVC